MTDLPISPPEFVPSVNDYVTAFRKIRPQITEDQLKMLINHHVSPGHVTTAGILSYSIGFENEYTGNIQYGVLAGLLTEALGLDWWGVSILVIFVPPDTVVNEEWLWVMRENVALALEELGWVKKTSPLYFPLGYDANMIPPEEILA